ncbi:hypothetical protein WMY93_000405 [Mugilogobius chulae]|uniref:Piezo-type mechanosensitive ion channel component n=1 Tax=Mugilogobius chulae TaxID=88201 RepID=A0AAW0Q217_9GOBI
MGGTLHKVRRTEGERRFPQVRVNVFFCLCSVIGADAGNGMRVFIPDIGMFVAGLGIWLLCRSLVQKRPPEEMGQYNAEFEPEEQEEEEKLSLDDDDNILLDDFEAGYEAEEDEDDEELFEDEEEDEEEEEEVKESAKMRVLRIVAEVASKVKDVIGNLITTAGKVVVTILLGMTGMMLPSLTSAVYFLIFLFLCTWWSLCRTFDTLLFSCMCVLMAIFSAGHIVVLYLYQFQFFQEAIPFWHLSIITVCSCTWKLSLHPKSAGFICEPVSEDTDKQAQMDKEEALCEDDETLGNGTNNSAERKRQLWWRTQQGTDERNAWSITYVSWLTFVFLMWSCMLWMVRDRRRYAMLTSPFMVAYGDLVIVLQYIWSFEDMGEISGLFVKKNNPFHSLSSKVLCLLTFWLLLRQTLTERQEKAQQDSAGLSQVQVDDLKKKGMFFFVSFEGTIVMYKIIYMMMFLSCVALYQVHYEWWRRILKYFWMSVVVYTMLVLTLSTPFSSAALWISGPGCSTWTKRVALGGGPFDRSVSQVSGVFPQTAAVVWWLLEIHIIKIVACYIVLVSVREVSLLNYVFLASWAFALPYSQYRPLASSVCTVWTCVIIICKMLYQLKSIDPPSYSSNCTMPGGYTSEQEKELEDSLLYKDLVDPANWVGLNKAEDVLSYLRVTIYRHQQYYRLRNKLSPPAARIIFHDITRQHLDIGIVHFVKYFINYFFYKFGLETCLLLGVNVIGQRMDFYSMLHAFALIAVMYRRRRKAIAEIWPKYCCFLACMLTFQYFVCIGIRLRLVKTTTCCCCAPLSKNSCLTMKQSGVRIMAGDNVEICRDLDAASFSVHNPVPDFIHCRSYLDMLKVIMFSYLFWFVLTIIFITGTTRISILACGYINSLVKHQCWLIQLFSLACTIKDYNIVINQEKLCPTGEAGIIWDSICFAFLLLQRRVFMSYYFLHVVADVRASQSSHPDSMVRSGDYYLFETDSEEEEEEEEKKDDEPPKKSAFQFLYHAWITDPKAALKARSKEKRKFWKKYTKGVRNRKAKKEPGHVTIDLGELLNNPETDDENKDTDGPDNIIKRVFNIIKFTWVLFQTTVDSFTRWMNEMCREYIDISTVLRIERCMLTREVKKGNVPTRESIHVYYQKAMKLNLSRESSLDQLSDDESTSGSGRVRRRRAGFRMQSQDSTASRDSMSSAYTEATMLFSRQSTLDELDGMPECRSSYVSSEATQCVTLFSRQGTTDTIEEVEDEQDKSAEKSQIVVPEMGESPWAEAEREESQADVQEVLDDSECPGGAEEENKGWETEGWEPFVPETEETTKEEEICEQPAADSDSVRPEDVEIITSADEKGFISESEDGTGQRHYLSEGALLYTPDTDASKTSDAEVPPSYSKAVSFDRLEVSDDESDMDRKRLMIMTPDSQSDCSRSDLVLPSMTTELTASELLLNKMFYDEELEESDKFYTGQPLILQLCYALYNMLVAHSEMVCFLVIIINHMVSASCITLVLPITIFLWAMLSVPRPSKRYWMTAIVYTEVTIVIKYFFQFGFFPFNQHNLDKNKAFYPPNIIGVEKKDGYVHYDLVQLLALFFHRSILKCHGLWDDDDPRQRRVPAPPPPAPEESEEEKTKAEESERESEPGSLRSATQRRGSISTLRSINFGTSIDSGQVQVSCPLRRLPAPQSPPPEARSCPRSLCTRLLAPREKHSAADITSSLSEDQVPGRSWRFSENRVAQMWYFVKCIYFGLSAYQIRCGYPTRVLGNFLTKSYNYVNLFLFQGFRMVPFLTELRAVMDWVWTDTSLSLSSWICVEDIYAHIFILKCWRESEKRYPQPRGQKKKKVVKYGMGGMIVVLLICIVWFPLLFMSLVKSVAGVVNAPQDVSFEITLAGFQPIFTMSAQQKQLQNVTPGRFEDFVKKYLGDDEALQWLESYMPEDLVIAELKGSSNSLWTISPPSRKNLIDMLGSNEDFPITVSWSVQRNLSLGAKAEIASGKLVKPLEPETKKELIELLNGTASKKVSQKKLEAGLDVYVFSDQVSPPSLGFLAGYGIMGLYASVVLVIGKFVESFSAGFSHHHVRRTSERGPHPQALHGHLLSPRNRRIGLRRDMYSKLIFLYRSPETMIKWTREKTQ